MSYAAQFPATQVGNQQPKRIVLAMLPSEPSFARRAVNPLLHETSQTLVVLMWLSVAGYGAC